MSDLPELDKAINNDAYEWLSQQAPAYIRAIEKELKGGATPDQIKRHVSAKVGPWRQGLALRCEQAALHLQGEGRD